MRKFELWQLVVGAIVAVLAIWLIFQVVHFLVSLLIGLLTIVVVAALIYGGFWVLRTRRSSTR